MFADAALAARIEAAEVDLCSAIGRATPGGVVTALAGGAAVLARPGGPINKVVGVGFAGVPSADELDALEAAWDAAATPVRFEISTVIEPALFGALIARGYRLEGFEHVLARRLGADDVATAAPGLTVEPVTAATSGLWLDLALAGFGAADGTGAEIEPQASDDTLRVIFEDFMRVDGLPRWIARVDGVAAGSASARFTGGVTLLCGASTIPAHRRRGVQRALLSARLALGAADGCDLAVVTTAPGSQSQANVSRVGFAVVYARAVLVRPTPAAS
jgi:GNAT superfamily N-acetyltransferase